MVRISGHFDVFAPWIEVDPSQLDDWLFGCPVALLDLVHLGDAGRWTDSLDTELRGARQHLAELEDQVQRRRFPVLDAERGRLVHDHEVATWIVRHAGLNR